MNFIGGKQGMKAGNVVMVVGIGILLSIAGCKSGNPPTAPQYSEIDLTNGGTIQGTVHYAKTPPKPIEIDMSQDPACTLGAKNFSEGYVVNGGDMANVFLYIKDGLGNRIYAAPTQAVDIDQKGCRYTPHVTAVMVGQPVYFMNSDPTMHNIHMTPAVQGNQAVDISQPPNASAEQRTFNKPELMIPVRCNNHPWMQAFINVAPNPYFAVSDAEGKYVIHGLPPGTYTLVADQENLGQKTMTVTVASKQTVTQDITYGQ